MNESILTKVHNRVTVNSGTKDSLGKDNADETESLFFDFGLSKDVADKAKRIFERLLSGGGQYKERVLSDESMAKDILRRIIRIDPKITKETTMIICRYLICKCDYITMSPFWDALGIIVGLSDSDFERLKKQLSSREGI